MASRIHGAAGRAASHLAVKRVYDPPAASDGTRVLVDRLWPREVAPSTELRHWFGHDPKRWDGFRERYAAELRDHSEVLDELRRLVRDGPVTLLFAAHDEEHNNAVALRDILGA